MIEHLFRRQAARIVSSLVGQLGSQHLQLAEDAVQEAMLKALRLWPYDGPPGHPEAWLFRVARNYAISVLRRTRDVELEALPDLATKSEELDFEEALRDDELRMIYICCHPDLNADARVALSLRFVGGFGVEEIARVLLKPESTVAQRLVRAKKIFRERALITFPSSSQLGERLDSILDTVYLMFSAGYTAASGEDLVRRDVCWEAVRLGRLISDSTVATSKAHALTALMAFQAARFEARESSTGELLLLEKQDRCLWDRSLIEQGFHYFERSLRGELVSVWHVQAAIAATYMRAGSFAEIDWAAVLVEYDLLLGMSDSPVVALNRAVVVSKVHGANAGLQAVDEIASLQMLANYSLLFAVRGHLLTLVGRLAEAEKCFAQALECNCSEPEKRFLQGRLADLMNRRVFL